MTSNVPDSMGWTQSEISLSQPAEIRATHSFLAASATSLEQPFRHGCLPPILILQPSQLLGLEDHGSNCSQACRRQAPLLGGTTRYRCLCVCAINLSGRFYTHSANIQVQMVVTNGMPYRVRSIQSFAGGHVHSGILQSWCDDLIDERSPARVLGLHRYSCTGASHNMQRT